MTAAYAIAPAAPEPMIPVFATKFAEGWPENAQGAAPAYTSIGEAFGTRYDTDAHFTAYSIPEIPRRVNLAAFGRPETPDGFRMVLAVFDIDDPAAHEQNAPASDAWREIERAKLGAFFATHPGAFAYETRGGYRLIAGTLSGVNVRTPEDYATWQKVYLAWVNYLRRAFGIEADPRCKDVTRFYRLWLVQRDGATEQRPAYGDPSALAPWTPTLVASDLQAPPIAVVVPATRTNGHVGVAWTRPCDVPIARRVAVAREAALALSPAVTGQKGHIACLRAASALYEGCLLSRDIARDIFVQLYNPRCEPSWSDIELDHKLDEIEAGKGATVGGYEGSTLDDVAIDEGIREAFARVAPSTLEPAPTDPARKIIRVLPHLIHQNTDEAIEALAIDSNRENGDQVRDRIYQRDGSLQRVVYLAGTDDDPYSPRLATLKFATLREHLTRTARWAYSKNTKGEGGITVAKDSLGQPPDVVIAAVTERKEYPGVRAIAGIAETPAFLRDGSILEKPGHDARSGFVYVPGAHFPPVPVAPSQSDAAAALESLREVWCDFPYKIEQDRMVPIAALLTLLARPAIGEENCPAFLFDANTRGSGKTRQVDALSYIATGRPFAKTTFPSDNVELEKMLGGFAVSGAAIVAFDNITGTFGGGPLDKVLTCGGRVQLRLLGHNDTPVLTWYAVVIGTGNNVVVIGDTARRTLVSRLESTLERPEDRADFVHPDLLPWVRAERPRLVMAGLTILRAWHLAGRPGMGLAPWGSFEAWSMVPRALAFAGAPNVLDCRAELREGEREDPDTEALRLILQNWYLIAPSGTASITELMAQLFPSFVGTPPGAVDPLSEARTAIEIALNTAPGRPPTKGQLGTWLGMRRGRNVGGLRLMKRMLNGLNRWCIQPC